MPLLLVLLLALTLLGHGTLLLARRELLASKAYLHAVQADLAAEGAISRVLWDLASLPGPRIPGLLTPLSSGWVHPDLWQETSLRWLSPELFVMEGWGRRRGWPGVRKKGALGWALDPVTRIGSLGAGVELGGNLILSPGAEATAADPLDLPVGWDPENCAGYVVELDSVYPRRTLPLTAPLPPHDSLPGEGPSRIPPLGLLSGSELLDRIRENGSLVTRSAPIPAIRGCPDSEASVFLGSASDLEIRDRRVCGLLVVEGDLQIEGTGTFQGMALVGGNLFLRSSGAFEGLARVRGSVRMEESAKIRISICPALRALSQTPSLLKPLLLPGTSLIPVF